MDKEPAKMENINFIKVVNSWMTFFFDSPEFLYYYIIFKEDIIFEYIF